ncbi:MAG: hypothetical protein ACLU9S_07610 [Oscillospiraceae bacterium]
MQAYNHLTWSLFARLCPLPSPERSWRAMEEIAGDLRRACP